jgi:hypothetical protein
MRGQWHVRGKRYFLCQFEVKAGVPGFRPVTVSVNLRPGGNPSIEIRMGALLARAENVTVTADVNESDVLRRYGPFAAESWDEFLRERLPHLCQGTAQSARQRFQCGGLVWKQGRA